MDRQAPWLVPARADLQARDEILAEHLSLVRHVARQLSRSLTADLDFDELVSAGTIGLMSAPDNFDVWRGLVQHLRRATHPGCNSR